MTEDIAKYIDHTLLKPEATEEDINKLVEEAKFFEFASVCVQPTWVASCYSQLKGTNVKVCTVIGFPLGVTTTETKVAETNQAIKDGAEEVDMVINLGALKSGNLALVEQDIAAVVNTAKGHAITKVIIETALLTEKEKVTASKLVKSAGADFIKTSTGFSTGGATVKDVQLMRETVGTTVGVKASGGIRSLKDLKRMIDAGANRIGASAGVSIMEESKGSN